ncbi:MAG TPA: VOC family protein [Pyrinomonadaceae bacterium]|nr:VOC family protein [Pyrinomonadaceae bacterium]
MKLHHTGFVVENISTFLSHLIFEGTIKEVYDPIQDANLILLSNYSNSYIELIQPLSEKSLTFNFLKKNGSGFHHFCYEIDNNELLTELVAKYKLIKVFGPVPALLFDEEEVVFYFTRNRQFVEFLLK